MEAGDRNKRRVVVDACGLSCPEPVMLTLEAIAKAAGGDGGEIEMLVDNPTARNNVLLAAGQRGWQGEYEADGDGTYHVVLVRSDGAVGSTKARRHVR